MKISFFNCVAVVIGLATILMLAKIFFTRLEPPPRIIPDMVSRPGVMYPQLPPPEAVPHESSPASQDEALDAAVLFARHCAACHGADGTGRSYVAAQPGMPEVNDLTATAVSPDELYRTLSNGRGAMPAHQTRLSEQARHRLIQYILHHLHQPCDATP